MPRKKKSSAQYLTITPAEVKAGMEVRVHQKIKDIYVPEKEKMKKTKAKVEVKERIQVFEGLVLKVKGSKPPSATFTVRKISGGIGVEKIFPLHSPLVEKIELIKEYKARRANLAYTRTQHRKLKEKRSGEIKQTSKKGKAKAANRSKQASASAKATADKETAKETTKDKKSNADKE